MSLCVYYCLECLTGIFSHFCISSQLMSVCLLSSFLFTICISLHFRLLQYFLFLPRVGHVCCLFSLLILIFLFFSLLCVSIACLSALSLCFLYIFSIRLNYTGIFLPTDFFCYNCFILYFLCVRYCLSIFLCLFVFSFCNSFSSCIKFTHSISLMFFLFLSHFQ